MNDHITSVRSFFCHTAGEIMSKQAGLIIVWRFEGRVHNDPWTLNINGDGDTQYYQIEVNNQRIKVRDKGQTLGTHPQNKGSMIPISTGSEITVVIDAQYPGEGKVRLVPMMRSGRLSTPTLAAKKVEPVAVTKPSRMHGRSANKQSVPV